MKAFCLLQNKKLLSFIIINILGGLAAGFLLFTETLSDLENRTWDWRIRTIAEHTAADKKIKIILVDQPSLDFFAREESIFWPWPRSIYSRIIDFLKLAQARAVAFDMMFSEDSLYSVEEDNAFAESMKGSLPVVNAIALMNSKIANDPLRFELLSHKQRAIKSEDWGTARLPFNTSRAAQSATYPIRQIIESSAALGDVSSSNDKDGIFRRSYAGSLFRDIPVLTLPFALYQAANPVTKIPALPFNKKNQLILRFPAEKNSFTRYPFSAIYSSMNRIEQNLTPDILPQEFRDSYVFVGVSAPGLMDLRPTPLNPKAPGVEINATVLDNLLNQRFVRDPSVFFNWVMTMIFLASATAGILFSTALIIQLGLSLLTLFALILSCYGLAFYGIWAQLVTPFICCCAGIFLATEELYRIEGARSRFIKKAFKYYVSPEIIEKIISNPSVLRLGGEKKELSIFFCDIAGFTGLSEKMDAADLVNFLNQFLSSMTAIILRHGGTVDKYVGDAIIAFWNAPLPVQDHAKQAVLTAIECQEALDRLRPEFKQNFGIDVHLRIGLHTGMVNVGNFGSADRFNYTVIGDSANLASRLEGANKFFGTNILFSESTYLSLKNAVSCIKLAKIKVLGREDPVSVYSCDPLFNEHEKIIWLNFLHKTEHAELAAAQELLDQLPCSELIKTYKKQFEILNKSAEKQNWSGILSLSEK